MITIDDLFKYVEILLPAHNCVVVPGFGGFIINKKESQIEENKITAPICSLLFNAALHHDDGLLITDICKKNPERSYTNIAQDIQDLIATVNRQLQTGDSIKCGNLGTLYMDEQALAFMANEHFVYPSFYGLETTSLLPFSELAKRLPVKKDFSKNNVSFFQTIKGVAAAIIVLLIFAIPSIHTKFNHIEQADFIGTINKLTTLPIQKHSPNINAIQTSSNLTILTQKTKQPTIATHQKIKQSSGIPYLLIIAGDKSKNKLLKKLRIIQRKDFPQAKIFATNKRYRIYVNSFKSKKNGIQYMIRFRSQYPKYKTAWLYKQAIKKS